MSTARIPPWLVSSQSFPHLTKVVDILTERESQRENARAASRRTVKSDTERRIARAMAAVGISKVPTDQIAHYSVTMGAHSDNDRRNRYYELEPYDRTRVIVDGSKSNSGRYLNASWVLERAGHKWWIAAQAPLPHTAHAFLSLIMQPVTHPPQALMGSHSRPESSDTSPKTSRIRTIVQLTQNVESGRTKAHAYFPSSIGKSLIVPAESGCSDPTLKVTLLKTREIKNAHCILSTISVVPIDNPPLKVAEAHEELEVDDDETDYGEEIDERIIFHHLLYTSWPDHGVPMAEDRASLIRFIKLVDSTNRDTTLSNLNTSAPLDPDPPIMVGCSAGIGRTGSFIAQSSLLRHLGFLPAAANPTPESVLPSPPLGPLPDDIKGDLVAEEVDSLREQRPGMVQRPDQVLLIYDNLVSAYRSAQPHVAGGHGSSPLLSKP